MSATLRAISLAAGDAAAASGYELMAARGYLRSAEYWRQAYFSSAMTSPASACTPGMSGNGMRSARRRGSCRSAWSRCPSPVVAALEAGWNVVAWDGPGQGGMRVEQGVAMRPDFEAVLTAVVDWAVAEGGGGHCEGLGQKLWQQAAFAWLSETIAGTRPETPVLEPRPDR